PRPRERHDRDRHPAQGTAPRRAGLRDRRAPSGAARLPRRVVPARVPAAAGESRAPGVRGAGHLGVDRRGTRCLRACTARAGGPRRVMTGESVSGGSVSGGIVRAARESDADGLARVQVASWRATFAGLVPDEVLGELASDEALSQFTERWLTAI